MNENDNVNISLFYRQATSDRNCSYPYISGDTFRAFSNYVFDETRQDKLDSIKYGDTIFVKADRLSQFFTYKFDNIQQPFVLITHNSDASAPNEYAIHLSNPKILQWYTSNPSQNNHSKLSPIPIGLANIRWEHGNLDKVKYAFKNHRKPWSQRTTLLYVNFDIETNKIERNKSMLQALKIKNAQIIKKRISFETYLEHIGNAKFVLSPPGGGIDCHRTWEALLMGSVPIILTSTLDSLFTKTKTIIIDDWSKLTEQFLLSFDFSSNNQRLPDVLYARYWYKTLFKYRNN